MMTLDFIGVVDSLIELHRAPRDANKLLEQASVINRLAMFGFSAAEA